MEAVLAQRFGTWTSLGAGFRALGHNAGDSLIGAAGSDASDDEWLLMGGFDIKIVQDIGRRPPEFWRRVRDRCRALVGIVNHRHPGLDTCAAFSLIATAFPHQVDEIATVVPCRYLPCAFDPRHLGLRVDGAGSHEDAFVAGAARPWAARDYPVTFCGSLGHGNVWDAGTHAMSAVAERVPGFAWWGPKVGPVGEALDRTWRGEAYGRAYVEILGRSRLALNRQGSTTLRHTTNMRNFEATGMGALLVTEASDNLAALFDPWAECATYSNPADLALTVARLLGDPAYAERIAAAGQARTLRSHTYARRAEVLADWCAGLLA